MRVQPAVRRCVFLKEKEKEKEMEKRDGEKRWRKEMEKREERRKRKEKEKGEGDGDMLNIRSEMPAPALPVSEDGGAVDARQRNFNPAVTVLSQRV